MPDPAKLLKTLQRATELFRKTPGRSGGVVSLEGAEDVMVVGDLHGNVPALSRLLRIAALDQHPRRHLVLQELVHGNRVYPNDGGDKSHQLVDLVAALKCQCPDRVHLILGNHELSEITGRVIGKNGMALNAFFRQGIATAYGSRADEVYSAYKALFLALPLAVRTSNRVFLCHTIPDAIYLDDIDPDIFQLDEWPLEAMKRGGAIYALTWGRDTSEETLDRFARLVDADWFITGHQPCDEGFQQPNSRQIIIDGTDPHPTYIVFPANEPVTIDSLVARARVLPVV